MSPFRESFSVIYWPSLLFSICPLVLPRPHWALHLLSELLLVYLLAGVHLLVGCLDIWDWVSPLQSLSLGRDTVHFIFFAIKLLYSLTNLLVVLLNLSLRRAFRATVAAVDACDVRLLELRVAVDGRRERRAHVLLLAPSLAVLLVYVTLAALDYGKGSLPLLLARFFFKYVFMALFLAYVTGVQAALLRRFQAVNRRLRTSAPTGAECLALAQIHCGLGDALRSHCRSCAVQSLAYFCPYILNIIYVYYAIYCGYVGAEGLSLAVDAELLFVCYSTLLYLLLVRTATRTTEQARLTRQLVHGLLGQAQVESGARELLAQFARQISHMQLGLSCGIFDYDWTFFMKVIGISTTYLIILIQFRIN